MSEFTPAIVDTMPILQQVDRLHEKGFAVARACVPELICRQLDREVQGLSYIPDESWRSSGGSRRPLYIGSPRTVLEQWLLSRPHLSTVRETGQGVWDALRVAGMTIPDVNRAVINKVVSTHQNTGRTQAGYISAHVDPDHYKGVVAAVSLQEGLVSLYESNSKGGKGKRLGSEVVKRGDVGLFLCAELAERNGIVRPLHEVANGQGVEHRNSIAYSHSVTEPLTAEGILLRLKQHFQRPA